MQRFADDPRLMWRRSVIRGDTTEVCNATEHLVFVGASIRMEWNSREQKLLEPNPIAVSSLIASHADKLFLIYSYVFPMQER